MRADLLRGQGGQATYLAEGRATGIKLPDVATTRLRMAQHRESASAKLFLPILDLHTMSAPWSAPSGEERTLGAPHRSSALHGAAAALTVTLTRHRRGVAVSLS